MKQLSFLTGLICVFAASACLATEAGKRGQSPFAGTARRVLRTNGDCPLFPGPGIVARHIGVFTRPPQQVPTQGMPDGPLLGNGDVGIVLAGPPEAQEFYIGKNDFWRSAQQPRILAVGSMTMDVPALAGATYRQEQDLARAEVRGTFTKGGLTVRTRSWVAANDNLLLTELQCEGQPVNVALRHATGDQSSVPASVRDDRRAVNVGREQFGGGRWYFDGQIADVVISSEVLSGKAAGRLQKPERFDGTTWHELAAPKIRKTVSVAAWIKIKTARDDANYIVSKGEWNRAYSLGLSNGRLRWAINGMFLQTKQPLEKGKWLYVAGTFDGKTMCIYVDGVLQAELGRTSTGDGGFTRKADEQPGGREVAVVTRVVGAEGMEFTLMPGTPVTVATAIVSDLDAKDYLPGKRGQSPFVRSTLRAVPANGDCPLFPAAKKLPAELTTAKIAELEAEHRAWWATFWSKSFIEIPDKQIEKHWYGALYVMASCSRPGKVAPGLWGNWITDDNSNWCGDFHLNYNFQAPFYMVYSANHADLSLPLYAAVGQFLPKARQMARSRGWKGIHFPVSIGPWGISTSGWEDLGQRSDGAYAALNYIWYWQYTQDDAWLKDTGYPYLREVAEFWEDYLKFENGRYVIYNDSIHEGSGPDFNPLLSLGLVRTLFKNMIPMSEELGVDANRRDKWQDICDKISDFPLQEVGGKTVFRYSEKGMAWCGGNTLGIQHIFPSGAIGLDSDPKLLEISRDMIDAMHRWADYNGFSSWYTACARVGYDPQVILAKLREECDKHSFPNLLLYYGGGGIESCGGFLAINEMLLQSHEGVIRFFPCWPKDQDARFGDLRAVGAFLISAELKGGVVCNVKITSEKGRDCTVQNPWPGKSVRMVRNGKLAETVSGKRFTLKTIPGEKLELRPQ